ncbi:response regulator transcription factor [Vallicoccus soli]|uniref:DNA-binding response regulator n=1 Tax=Vallicoccus soli TaxID=2339232 RepID=A0A3A3YMZ4_9ACTN|nr:response regulator transcription factor [Vallicoccus soli]RJK92759.1 DNA-binding response regulator [Vallicoccus soli]
MLVEGLGVLLVDDHPLFLRGLEILLPSVSDGRIRVVGTTDDAAAAAGLVRRTAPDVAVVDLHMPAPGGVRAIAAVRRADPRVRVVAMSGTDDQELALSALEAGAEGYLPKTAEPEDLVPPLLAVVEGWSVLPAPLLTALLQRRSGSAPASVVSNLSQDELRLWRLVAAGRSTVDIAAELHVSERTVKRFTAALLRRLHVATRAEAAALAGRTGLLDGDGAPA